MTRRWDLVRERVACRAEEELETTIRIPAQNAACRRFIDDVFSGEARDYWDELPVRFWRAAAHADGLPRPEARQALGRIVRHLDRVAPDMLWGAGEELPGGLPVALVRLAALCEGWLRDPVGWLPCGSGKEAFSELARFLLARYPVPPVLDELFFTPLAGMKAAWFRHVGQGGNLRTAPGLAVPLTTRMAHHALLAPPELRLLPALRWGQMLGMGATEAIARAVAKSGLGWELGGWDEENWWLTVLRWFANHPELEAAEVGPLIDFVRSRRRSDPGFSMKGRTPAALQLRMRSWHAELRRRAAAQKRDAAPTGPPPFRASGFSDGEWTVRTGAVVATWTMREIRTREELVEEGWVLHHCVATYEERIRQKTCSIWSLSVVRSDGLSGRMLTLEVHNRTRAVVQIRGAYNRLASFEEREIVDRWTAGNGLDVLCC